MKIEITLQVKGIRCLQGLFSTFLRILFSNKLKTALYLIYFCQTRQVRFLIDSEQCNAILAIDDRIIITDRSSTKEGTQLLVVQFKSGSQILQALCDLADQQGFGELNLSLSKERGENPFRSLNIHTITDKFRSQIFKPLYDPPVIVNHIWLSGCASSQQKKVQFDMDTENILNILRVVYRDKQLQGQQKLITVKFLFLKHKYTTQLQKLMHHSEGQVVLTRFGSPKYEGNYQYSIQPSNAGKLYELLQGKSSGSRIIINNQNQLVFSYFQQGVYESQLFAKDWIQFQNFEPRNQGVAVKLQF